MASQVNNVGDSFAPRNKPALTAVAFPYRRDFSEPVARIPVDD